jgi:hypothetical protein
MDAEEIALFAKSVQQVVARDDIDRGLRELGWVEALEASPATAVDVLFSAQGAAAATSTALHLVLAAGLGASGPVLLPALDSHDVPGVVESDRVHVSGLAIAPDSEHLLVPVGGGLVRVATSYLSLRVVHGIDPAYHLVEVTGSAPFDHEPASDRWVDAVALGHRALAAELVGAGRTMLELARTHALDREQFGRPISAFQAVRHRLADTLVALESADGLIAASWEDDAPVLAAMAKAVAGRAARTATRHCQQVLAGIGFTTEHRFHRYLRRTLLLDQLLGSSRTLTRDLGTELLTTRHLPTLLPL